MRPYTDEPMLIEVHDDTVEDAVLAHLRGAPIAIAIDESMDTSMNRRYVTYGTNQATVTFWSKCDTGINHQDGKRIDPHPLYERGRCRIWKRGYCISTDI